MLQRNSQWFITACGSSWWASCLLDAIYHQQTCFYSQKLNCELLSTFFHLQLQHVCLWVWPKFIIQDVYCVFIWYSDLQAHRMSLFNSRCDSVKFYFLLLRLLVCCNVAVKTRPEFILVCRSSVNLSSPISHWAVSLVFKSSHQNISTITQTEM